jgi:hypothetical protein
MGAAATPPTLPGVSARKLALAAKWARVSGGSVLVLGVLSALTCVRQPLTAGFVVSLAVLVNGAVEWIWAERLRTGNPGAPRVLAWNQVALGLEIALYAAWQMVHLTPDAIQRVLAGPLVRMLLGRLSREETAYLLALLQPMVLTLYGVVGLVAVASCGGVALFYLSRRRFIGLNTGG